MSEWKTYRLGDIIQLKSGGTPDKSNSDYWGGSIPWISAKSMYDDFISTSDLFITEEGLHAGSKIAKKDSILLLTRGSGLFNRIPVCYVVSDVAYNQDVKNIVLKKESITSIKFLYYWLYGNKELLSSMLETTGIGAGKIDTKRFLNLSISLPSQREQARYIYLMDLLFDKIELNRRINANLEAQAQALFKSWFVDFEPFHDGPFVDSELGKIPQGWKVGGIYTYMDVIYGAPYKSALFNTDKKGYPLIRIRDLKTYSPQFYTEEILPNTEYVDFGDIVAGMDAEFVPYIWKGEKGLLNQRVCKFIPKYDYVSKYYILSLIRPELEFVQSYKVGTTVSHLGKSDIDKFKVITPPAEIVKRFSCIVDSFHQQIIKLAKENFKLSALRDTLLPRLMAGEKM